MINFSLFLNTFVLQPSFKAANSDQTAWYFYGTIITIIVVVGGVNYAVFKPLEEELTKKKRLRTPPKITNPNSVVKNELDYADYLAWTAKKGEEPYIKKKIMNNNTH